MEWRIKTLQVFFILWAMIIIGRLGYWQIIKAEDLKTQANLQYGNIAYIPAPRGEIKSSDGFPLVSNIDTFLLYINPKVMKSQWRQLQDLVDTLPSSDSAREILNKPGIDNLSWLAVARNLTYDFKTQIEKLGLTGLGFEIEPGRIYPEGSFSAYLTGFVGKDESGKPKGYFGLEGYYDRELTGKPGKIVQDLDAVNQPILIGNQNKFSSQSGRSLVTSIDRTVQYLAFKKLEWGLQKYQAKSGTITIMESATGRILAMVSLPGYDPAKYSSFAPDLYKNPIVSEAYEPGSTFKTIVMSSALDTGVVSPDTICDICSGPVNISNYTIRSWNNHYYPDSSMTDVILHSDNVGMVFVSRKLGQEKLISYLKKFGIGQPTGVDLQEESVVPLRPDNQWREIDLATSSFGQGIAVTPLQMVTAVNAIANKGVLVYPRLVQEIISDSGTKKSDPPASKRIISLQAAEKIKAMMVNGVNNGEVRYYKPAGYTIAGKTGTAQVPIEGHYDKDKTIASFIAFAPADNPKFTMLVTLTEPQTSPWGSTTTAPLWFELAKELFKYYRIFPNN